MSHINMHMLLLKLVLTQLTLSTMFFLPVTTSETRKPPLFLEYDTLMFILAHQQTAYPHFMLSVIKISDLVSLFQSGDISRLHILGESCEGRQQVFWSLIKTE